MLKSCEELEIAFGPISLIGQSHLILLFTLSIRMRESHDHLRDIRFHLRIQQLQNQHRINIKNNPLLLKLSPKHNIPKLIHILPQLTETDLIAGNANIHEIIDNGQIRVRDVEVHLFLFLVD